MKSVSVMESSMDMQCVPASVSAAELRARMANWLSLVPVGATLGEGRYVLTVENGFCDVKLADGRIVKLVGKIFLSCPDCRVVCRHCDLPVDAVLLDGGDLAGRELREFADCVPGMLDAYAVELSARALIWDYV